ncbi:MAG: ferredoxin [Candidatus Cloacimonetes bacterium]|nr:ferredoxin [Candidatus Cloacimonadota bacterium]
MDNQLALRIDADWAIREERLQQRVNQAADWLRDILAVERHHSEGHEKGKLKAALGTFGGGVLDSGAMSEVLGRVAGSHVQDPARIGRITSLLGRLEAVQSDWNGAVGGPVTLPMDGGATPALEQAAASLDRLASVFAALRQAAMERHGRYREELHRQFFDSFNRTHLDSSELALCPPLLALVPASGAKVLGTVMELLGSGLPVKVLLLSSLPSLGSDSRLPGLEVELLPLTLQTVFVIQCTRACSQFDTLLGAALASPRAALVSLVWGATGDAQFSARANQAVVAREFPVFAYDPDRSERFVERLSLDGNPDLDAAWARVELHHRDASNQPLLSEARMTCGEYHAGDVDADSRFTTLEEEHRGRHLSEWFGLDATERKRTIPFVYRVRQDRLSRVVPDRELLAHCVRRAQVWETLRELAGVHNPHVEHAERSAGERMRAERDASLAEARQELQRTLEAEKQAAVELAMQNLARQLLGLGSGALLGGLSAAGKSPATAAPAASASAPTPGATEPEPQVSSDEFWLDTPLCTACDECTSINPAIFAYNKNKQAVIINPTGGPFKDIVKAAEKCSAKIIHPGKPHDPTEKGLDKLIERASKFN